MQLLFACTILAALMSCNGRVKKGRILYGVIHDSSDRAVSNHVFFVLATKTTGSFPNRVTSYEPFKFTTDTNGYFYTTYDSQNTSEVMIGEYEPGQSRPTGNTIYWLLKDGPANSYNAGLIKIKQW